MLLGEHDELVAALQEREAGREEGVGSVSEGYRDRERSSGDRELAS